MRQCIVCKRGSNKVNARSHSNEATIRRQRVNLAKTRFEGKRVLLCTSCLKTQAKVRAIA